MLSRKVLAHANSLSCDRIRYVCICSWLAVDSYVNWWQNERKQYCFLFVSGEPINRIICSLYLSLGFTLICMRAYHYYYYWVLLFVCRFYFNFKFYFIVMLFHFRIHMYIHYTRRKFAITVAASTIHISVSYRIYLLVCMPKTRSLSYGMGWESRSEMRQSEEMQAKFIQPKIDECVDEFPLC